MIWHQYKLDPTVKVINEPLTLWTSEKGSVSITKGALAAAVTVDGETEGYILSGNGRLILDTIVETEQGAIGKSIEKEITEPFLMIGNPQQIEPHLTPADRQTDFLAKAENLHRRFFQERATLEIGCHNHYGKKLIFAFDNGSTKFDLLIPNGSRLIYKAEHLVFISDENRVVLKSPEHTVVSGHGRCIIVQ